MQYQHGILAEIEMEIRHGSMIFKMSKTKSLTEFENFVKSLDTHLEDFEDF